jgi:Sulfotransferase family/Putative peptidoglycan binding domain
MGKFTVDVAISYQIGAARGDRSILSAMDIQRDEFFASFGRSITDLILKHRDDLDRRRMIERVKRSLREHGLYDCEVTGDWNADVFAAIREYQIRNRLEVNGQLNAETLGSLEINYCASKSKTRWVDGTPEYSFYVCALRKLFPQALFVHLVRDVRDVVRSLLNFFSDGRNRLVASEQAAYEYWLRRATCCFEAEQAYGLDVVYRIRYSDLVEQPESAMRSLLEFLGETYAPECLEPLAQRINTANVPANFDPTDPETDPAIVEQARHLSDLLKSAPQQPEPSAEIAKKLEAEFSQRVEYFYDLSAKYNDAQQLIARLQDECALLNAAPLAGKR